ncbi:putative GTPase Era, mitochondrial [Apostichopus japonicus]|uniref:GTPase Era, mitochondrial n=1 Tax=Stichopus japonicus TaxID=307972 RepID=A0A2G8KUI9_STIJA|nr:putative GTPase Era, mitochondrial [Apostichopus japonicus]
MLIQQTVGYTATSPTSIKKLYTISITCDNNFSLFLYLDHDKLHLSQDLPAKDQAMAQRKQEKTLHDDLDTSFFNPVSLDKASHEMLLIRKPNQPADARVLRVAIIGSPNAGKSTLVNGVLKRRIFSVSRKVHTTRARATGVLTHGRNQIIFLDTPGIVNHKHGRKHQLPRPLLIDAKNVLEEADLVAVIVDASNKWTRCKLDPEIMVALHHNPDVPTVLVLNKEDKGYMKYSFNILTMSSQLIYCKTNRLCLKLWPISPRASSVVKSLTLGGSGLRRSNGKPETTAGDDFSPSGRGGKAWFEEEEANRSRTTGDLTSEGDKNGSTERLLGDGESRETASEIIQRSQQKSETDGLHSDDEGKSQEANREPFPHLGDDDKNNKLQELITNLDLLIGDDRRNARENYLIHSAKPGMWEYHSDTVTDLPPEEIVSEAIREKLLEYLPQEVPYRVRQVNELWQIGENEELQIFHKIVCSKKSHVGMIEKRMGRIVKEATQDLMNAFHCDVFLKIHVAFESGYR